MVREARSFSSSSKNWTQKSSRYKFLWCYHSTGKEDHKNKHPTPQTKRQTQRKHYNASLLEFEVQYQSDSNDKNCNYCANDPLVSVHPPRHGGQNSLALTNVVIHSMKLREVKHNKYLQSITPFALLTGLSAPNRWEITNLVMREKQTQLNL